MAEKRIRRSNAEVESLVAKAKQLVKEGTPATKACEQLGLTYQTYQRRADKKTMSSAKGSSGKVSKLLDALVAAIREEVRQEIKASL